MWRVAARLCCPKFDWEGVENHLDNRGHINNNDNDRGGNVGQYVQGGILRILSVLARDIFADQYALPETIAGSNPARGS
jgi:hypothetical protein